MLMKSRNVWAIALGLEVFLFFCVSLSPVISKPNTAVTSPESEKIGQVLPIGAKVTLGKEVIELEVAQTPEQQALGLMYRQSLADNRGMLFPFERARMTQFWMKNCLISLDLIFLRDNKVQAIAKNAPPCQSEPCPTYGPSTLVDAVIELKGGRAEELGLNVGDSVAIELGDILPR
jgi:hypothetical protein